MQPNRTRIVAAAPLALLLLAAPALGAAKELEGAAVLEHACGKTSVKYMGLVKAGKIEESVKMGTKEMQEQWAAMPKEDREMMSGMMKDMAMTEAELSDAIKSHGVMTVEGDAATLVVKQERNDASGSGTSTMTQRFKIEGDSCKISR
jgi:hypothetical protein